MAEVSAIRVSGWAKRETLPLLDPICLRRWYWLQYDWNYCCSQGQHPQRMDHTRNKAHLWPICWRRWYWPHYDWTISGDLT